MSMSDYWPMALSISILLATFEDKVTNSESVNVQAPFEINPKWKKRKNIAKRKVLFAGLNLFLISTWEENNIIITILVNAIGRWTFVICILDKL